MGSKELDKDFCEIYRSPNGSTFYMRVRDNRLHRVDGPAVVLNNGDKKYYQNGKLHRMDGPAIDYADGIQYWYLDGEEVDCISQEEFIRFLNLKVFW